MPCGDPNTGNHRQEDQHAQDPVAKKKRKERKDRLAGSFTNFIKHCVRLFVSLGGEGFKNQHF